MASILSNETGLMKPSKPPMGCNSIRFQQALRRVGLPSEDGKQITSQALRRHRAQFMETEHWAKL
jgi:hypothetical protein